MSEGRALAAAIPGAQFVELSGGDWWPFLGDADELLSAFEAFVLSGGAPAHPAGGRGPDTSVSGRRALATVLFTDIVDSTAHSAEIGDAAWAEVRAQHDAIVRRELLACGGREIKTMGDGFLATFDGPARGVECALAIVHGVEDLGIEVRAGLHTGEVTFDDDDVTGIGVAIGARVSALAGASEVLVSQTVKDLTAGSGLSFDDAGDHELKGVPDRWHLFRVVR